MDIKLALECAVGKEFSVCVCSHVRLGVAVDPTCGTCPLSITLCLQSLNGAISAHSLRFLWLGILLLVM